MNYNYMKTNFVTQVVPALPPQSGAAGSYALDLACQLRDRCGINSQFILCDPDWDGPVRIDGFAVRRLRVPNEACLWGLLAPLKENSPVLLHYDGCAYQKGGVPTWLYQGIKSWLADGPQGRQKQFFTVFHELWRASAKPWQGWFYARSPQKRLVEKLHGLSRISITNTQHRQTQLDTIVPGKTLLLPFPSRLPIIDRNVPGARPDKPLLVTMMTQAGARTEAINAHANLLRTLDKSGRLAGVSVVGGHDQFVGANALNETLAELRKNVSPARVQVLEHKKSEDVSRLLSQTDLFLSSHFGEAASDSGTLMPALAAGCVAVLRDGRHSAPLQESKHFVASDDSPSSVERFERMAAGGELERIATAGRMWYQRYADWKVIALKYQEALQSPIPLPSMRGAVMNLPLLTLEAPTR